MIVEQQADALVAYFVVDLDRAARMDYTSGVGWAEPYNLAVPIPGFRSRLFAFVRPFQPMVNFQFLSCWFDLIRFWLIWRGGLFNFRFGLLSCCPSLQSSWRCRCFLGFTTSFRNLLRRTNARKTTRTFEQKPLKRQIQSTHQLMALLTTVFTRWTSWQITVQIRKHFQS